MSISKNQKKELPTNKKAAEVMAAYSNYILTYLNSHPDNPDSKKKYNHIYAVPADERNDNNGYANFRIMTNETNASGNLTSKTYNVRLETDFFGEVLTIPTVKVWHLCKADIIILANKEECYISTKNEWLKDKNFYSQKQSELDSKKILNSYNILSLACHGYVTKLIKDEIENNLILVNDCVSANDFLDKQCNQNTKIFRTRKPFIDFGIDTCEYEYVQYDLRIPQVVFWNFACYNYTDNQASLPLLASTLADKTDWDVKSIYRKLLLALNNHLKDGKTHIAKIPANRKTIKETLNLQYDDAIFDDKYNLCIAVSKSPDFSIQDNKIENATKNMKEYQKEYQKTEGYNVHKIKVKIRKWLKTHNNEYNPKWTDEEVLIANEILSI